MRVPVKEFYEAISRLRPALDKGNQMLECIRVDTKKGGVRIGATNLLLSLQEVIATPFVEEETSFCVPGRSLIDVFSVLSGDEATLVSDGTTMKIKSKKSQFSIPVYPSTDYPLLPDFTHAEFSPIDGKLFVDSVMKVAYASGNDITAPYKAGIHIEKARMMCSDGIRIALIQNPGFPVTKPVLVPAALLKSILPHVGETVDYCESEREVHFRVGGMIASIRLIETPFPDIVKAIPVHPYKEATVPREPFIRALRRVNLSAGPAGAVKLHFVRPGLLTVSAKSEGTEASEELDVQTVGTMEVFFKAQFLLDSLERCQEENVVLQLRSERVPLVIQEGNYQNVILPRLG